MKSEKNRQKFTFIPSNPLYVLLVFACILYAVFLSEGTRMFDGDFLHEFIKRMSGYPEIYLPLGAFLLVLIILFALSCVKFFTMRKRLERNIPEHIFTENEPVFSFDKKTVMRHGFVGFSYETLLLLIVLLYAVPSTYAYGKDILPTEVVLLISFAEMVLRQVSICFKLKKRKICADGEKIYISDGRKSFALRKDKITSIKIRKPLAGRLAKMSFIEIKSSELTTGFPLSPTLKYDETDKIREIFF